MTAGRRGFWISSGVQFNPTMKGIPMNANKTPRDQRKVSLRGLSHVIARKLNDLCMSYFNLSKEPPPEFLARTFEDEVKAAHIRGGPVTRHEAQLMLNIFVPRALEDIRRRIATTDERIAA
jgi:hypothetical protein